MTKQPPSLIQILPPQLANQIAAGEVVERPASVVKELVENSLDAGATQIQIDIEKGGAQLIRIRDNGCGIGKQDLALALARHATSKIATLEDLESILSLGFRGEALASISSVSRLTLTSRPEYQTEAWQAYAQGRDMAVEIQPASHPIGTTIEVANLFFNTPARRKFLRTDKTEFAHIDEVVRRIALAKPNVTFTLTHNDKKVRYYKAVNGQDITQQQKRVAAICGEEFVTHASHLDWQHGDLHLHGWIGAPHLARPQNDLCYSYVNGRMMRDKTINHAIRLAYGDSLPKESYPAFVLFLDLSPSHVDVNVHPAKHEVRFHQGRLVHDFIYQGVLNALAQGQGELPWQENCVQETVPTYVRDTNRAAAGRNVFSQPTATKQPGQFTPHFTHRHSSAESTPSRTSQKWYGELLRTETASAPIQTATPYSTVDTTIPLSPTPIHTQHSHALAIVEQQALLLKQGEQFYLLSLDKLARLKLALNLEKPESQSLLIPLSLSLTAAQADYLQQAEAELAQLGFRFQLKNWQNQTRLTLQQVPTALREQNLQQLLLGLVDSAPPHAMDYLLQHCTTQTPDCLTEAVAILSEIEQSPTVSARLNTLRYPLNWHEWLAKL